MKRLPAIAVAVVMLTAVPAFCLQLSLTGNQLKQDALSQGAYSKGYFEGYVLGVLESAKDRLCVPERVEMGQALEVIEKYLNEHPQELHLPASGLVLKAIQAAWPCN